MAPGAAIDVIEAAPGNTNSQILANLITAVQTANTTPGVTVVSMSWGLNEFSNETSYDSYFTTPGITYIASSGDSGVVEWPSVSPNVLAVGGTLALPELARELINRRAAGSTPAAASLSTRPSRAYQDYGPVNGLPEHARRLVRCRPEYRRFRLRRLAEQQLGPGTVGSVRRHERRRPVLGRNHRHHRSGPRTGRPG